ncbi:MAG: fluoride efflux transporter CrcB [Spirochaetaceae bacterium]|jgi:CrcB protein|nr:fluoride efflux transporter CrcB [Spirochaetaceae bacterium]
MTYLFVLIGGGIGALMRHLSTQFFNAFVPVKYPLGTLFVNCLGALLIGFLINAFDETRAMDTTGKPLLITGFLGGYTTFSTYSLETARYFLDGNPKLAVLNIVLHNGLCLVFVLLGMALHRALAQK